MFLRYFDMGSVVVLKNTDLSISGILKGLSEALNCNVFVDGLVDEVFPRAGAYRASDLLDALSKLWKCSWGFEEGNVYIIRDFTKENQFPDISLGEMKEFARAVSSRLTQKYSFDPAVTTPKYLEELIRDVKASVSPKECARLESSSGLRLGLLQPALQDRVMAIMYAGEIGSAKNYWSRLSTLLQNLDAAEFRITGPASAQIQGAGDNRPLSLSLKPSENSAAVEALYQRLAKQSAARAGSYATTEQLKAPDRIHGHFVAGAAVVNPVQFYKGLAKLNQWQCSVGKDNTIALEPKKYSETDDVLDLLPEEYRRYIAAGVNKLNALYIPPRFELMATTGRFSTEGELLAGVLKKVLAGRMEIRLSRATDLEKYLLARIALNSIVQMSLGRALIVDTFPDGYLADSKNAYLRFTGGNNYGISYSGGSLIASAQIPATRRLFGSR
ncbi:MAG: hypothetical protein QM758_23145 [Armatimonas sp.]